MPTGSTYTAASYTDSRIGNLSGEANVQGYVNMMTAGAHTYTDSQITANNTAISAGEIIGAHREDVENDTLDNRFDDVEYAISHTADPNDSSDNGGLDERITTVEGVISNIVTNINNATLDNSTTYADLDARFEAIESGLGALANVTSTTVISTSDFNNI